MKPFTPLTTAWPSVLLLEPTVLSTVDCARFGKKEEENRFFISERSAATQ
jgi:hypothetical protein